MTTELGQVGTQFDGFAHQTHGDSFYNCFKVSEVATRNGFTKLGIEKVGAVVLLYALTNNVLQGNRLLAARRTATA